jgi:transcriptional regulator with XRE-family HTH domain
MQVAAECAHTHGMATREELRDFLRSRRDRLLPSDIGLADDRPRRVPGLRREEVARLAGVSVDYYTRLEQGRGIGVSGDVLHAIADALQLAEDERSRLFDIAQPTRDRRNAAASQQRVRHSVIALLELLPLPAVVVGRGLDILASNPLARALLCDFDSLPRDRCNQARWIFLDPLARERYLEWETVARDSAADLYDHASRYPHDRKLVGLIDELTARSPEFQAWWRDTEPPARHFGTRHYEHPAVGELTLRHEALVVVDADDQVIHVDIAEPGSASELALHRLVSSTSAESTSRELPGPTGSLGGPRR